jgi:hypothetical protein
MMTISAINGAYTLRSAREEVFVADQPGRRPARYAAHTGHALLLGWLDPAGHAGEPLARLRLPDGTLRTVAAAHVCPADGLARRRILPRPAPPTPITRIIP